MSRQLDEMEWEMGSCGQYDAEHSNLILRLKSIIGYHNAPVIRDGRLIIE